MAVSYKKLFHLLIDKDISVADLQRQAGYSANISTRLRNNSYVSLESMEKICWVLDCKLDDVVEFLDLPDVFHENDFRKALVKGMRDFILELGKDFTFVGEEYPIQVGGEDYRIDLLFFHRSLHCLVAMELKVEKFKPEYVSKMDFYLEGLDRQIRKPDENPSVGLLLCASKNDEVVEYAMSRTLSPMMVAQYQMQLPNKDVLRKKLQELSSLPEIKENTGGSDNA